MSYQGLYRRLLALVLTLVLAALTTSASAQRGELSDAEWSTPQLLFESPCELPCKDDPRTIVTKVVADASGRAHLFWHSGQVIYHASRSRVESKAPNDILIGLIMPVGAAVSPDGVLHLVAPTEGQCVGYSWVPAEGAGDPRLWSAVRCLGTIGASSPDLAVDGDGVLYVAYAERGQESLAFTKSVDGGKRWSYPAVLATTDADPEAYIGYPQLVADDQGRLHATWGEVQAPDGYPWRRIMYAQSLDGGESWSLPVELADEREGEPNLAVYGNTVHVVWNGDVSVKERYYRSSDDGGLTWSPRETIPVTGGNAPGLQGPPALVVDSLGTAHILVSRGRLLYYITRADGQWSEPVLIAGPENAGSTGEHSELNHPSLGITEGNRLHALYSRDLQAAYYQTRTIDAPQETPVAWPTQGAAVPVPTSPPTPEIVAVSPSPQPSAAGVGGVTAPAMPDPGPGVPPFAIGGLAALGLVVLLVTLLGRARRRL